MIANKSKNACDHNAKTSNSCSSGCEIRSKKPKAPNHTLGPMKCPVHLSDVEARDVAEGIWTQINLKNLEENILPTRQRADLIIRKRSDHKVEEVALRKL